MPENLQEVDPSYRGAHSDLYNVRLALEKDLPKILDAVKSIGTPAAEKAAKMLDGLADKGTEEFAKSLKDASDILSKDWSDEFTKQLETYKKEIKSRLDNHVARGILSPEQARAQLKDSLDTKKSAVKMDLERKYQHPLYFIRSLSNVQGSKLSWSNVGSKRTEKDLFTTKTGWGKPLTTVDRVTGLPADKGEDDEDDLPKKAADKGKSSAGPAGVMKRKAGETKPKPVGWDFDKFKKKEETQKENRQLFERVVREFASGRDHREPNWDLLEVLF